MNIHRNKGSFWVVRKYVIIEECVILMNFFANILHL